MTDSSTVPLVSLQLYTVRDALRDDLPGTIARIAEAGFDGVEPFRITDLAHDLATSLRRTGLAVPSAHAKLVDDDLLDAALDAAELLGVTTLIDPRIDPALWQDRDGVRRAADALNAAAERASHRGVRVGYHNHDVELRSRIDGTTALELFAAHLDPRVVLEVDVYWAAYADVDPSALIRRLADRVRFLHVKDAPAAEGRSEGIDPDIERQVPFGDGALGDQDLLAAATAAEAWVVEFDRYAGDPLAGATRALSTLRDIAAVRS